MTNETATNSTIRLPWAGKQVRMEEVEEALSTLWKLSADNMRISQNTNVRTSVLNFVICASNVETAQRASALLRDLSSTHLGRVIVLILDAANTSNTVSTWITLRCFSVISDVMRHCFEQTTILASGSATSSIANIVQPLLKPELPVYLWWIGDPPDDDRILTGLMEISSRVLIDSTTFFHPEQDILNLTRLRQLSSHCALSDLSWGRITPWRQLISQFFDVAEYRPYLNGLTSIEIEHAALPGTEPTHNEKGEISPNPTCALLLAAWLKDRLNWSLTANSTRELDSTTGTYQWSMERNNSTRLLRRTGKLSVNQEGRMSIQPQVQPNMPPGSICLVRLLSTIEEKQATFTISREGDPDHVFISVELTQETRPPRTANLTSMRKTSDLLHDELEITGHDHLFEQTLREVAELLE